MSLSRSNGQSSLFRMGRYACCFQIVRESAEPVEKGIRLRISSLLRNSFFLMVCELIYRRWLSEKNRVNYLFYCKNPLFSIQRLLSLTSS
jgi:hypothetical protein